jgi:hypothetical protein
MKVRNSEICNVYIELNNVDVLKLQLGWTGYIIKMKMKGSQDRYLVGNVIIQNEWENQE